MKPFEYFNPTRLIFGNRQKEIGQIIKNDGHKRILLLYGKNSIKQSGLYDDICKALKNSKIEIIEHSGVSSNPTISHAKDGVLKAKDVTAILAVGGGSVIDEAKTIAAATLSGCDPWDLFQGKQATYALDIYTILTISATGSEMNCGAVITNETTNEKLSFQSPLVYPKVSIVNPALAITLPNNYLAYSAVDIIAHVIEIYFTSQNQPNIQNRFAENIIITTMETTEKILKNPHDLDARSEFALASTWALNGLTALGVGKHSFPNHMIEHSLSAIYNIAHGAGLSIVIPAWLKWFSKNHETMLLRFSKIIFNTHNIEDGISSLEQWFKKIGAPTTLNDVNIPKSDVKKISQNIYKTSIKWGLEKIYTIEVITEILNLTYKD